MSLELEYIVPAMCSVSPAERIEIIADWACPEIRIVNNIVAYVAGHIELQELPVAAGFFKGRKVFPVSKYCHLGRRARSLADRSAHRARRVID